jgi:two-component system chemotaxis sensor kinase CheA
MSKSSEAVLKPLNQQIDYLAGRAMMLEDRQDELGDFVSALREFASRAETAGYPELCAAAREAEQQPLSADAMRQAMVKLQNALEQSRAAVPAAAKSPATPAASFAADIELLNDFIVETRDHLTTIEAQVLTLEQDPGNKEAVHATFRSFHSIKGLAGFLELNAIQLVAHEVETLLDQVRNGALVVTPTMVDAILAGADYLKTDVARVEMEVGGAPAGKPEANDAIVRRVQALMSGAEPPADAPAKTVALPEIASDTQEAQAEGGQRDARKTAESRIVKVDTTKLDFLVDMVGELVIAQSLIRHDGDLSSVSTPQLQRNLAQLSRITGEVQKTAMAMRMVPIGQLFHKAVRLVRDLTRRAGKRAEVDIIGEDTELDRTIVEDLSDPLVHMIRNATDHGIEPPEERRAAGKNPVARIGLKAYHQAGHIVVELSDDGRGLSREKILKKAVERGLIQKGATLSDKEVFNLIFEPGFSTAEQVTDVSGRGVGMDVVRLKIVKMRGQVDIESQPGKGTTFFLKLPLTLAIIDGLVVGVGNQRYIVPIFGVREIFRPTADCIFTVENQSEMIRVRKNLLPVVRLHRRFNVAPKSEALTDGVAIVAESLGRRFCLIVDELVGKQEVVIKSLGETFKRIRGLAGGAILGDGKVGLIIDMDAVFGGAAGIGLTHIDQAAGDTHGPATGGVNG